MTKQIIKPAYAKIDPAHLFDGLFVPTNGKRRGRLYVAPRCFGSSEISYQGFEQLGTDDQSVLLAITAQLGINGLIIDHNPIGDISKQLRTDIFIKQDDRSQLASKQTTLRSILIDAGYDPDSSTDKISTCLNRLRSAQIREVNKKDGWDRVCNLISTSFNKKTGETYIAANPRLTGAVFRGQHVRVSLYERNALNGEVAKILHSWLCSNIRPGKSLGNGSGAELDTLAPHVWGGSHDDESTKIKSVRRGLLRDGLSEIKDLTKHLHNGNECGWVIDQTSAGLVIVSRPKDLPMIELATGMTPGQLDSALSIPADFEM